MRCLWLTRKLPRPVNSGELIDSNGMISSSADTAVDLAVIAHDNEESPVGDSSEASRYEDAQGVEWRLGQPELRRRRGSLLVRLPADSYRLRNGGSRDALSAALAECGRDAIIIDHAAMGYALEAILAGLRHAVENLPDLVKEVIAVVDDVPRRNRMSEASFRKCGAAFRWRYRGRSWLVAIESL